MDVTTATRLTSYFFIAAMTVAVPACFERRWRRGETRTRCRAVRQHGRTDIFRFPAERDDHALYVPTFEYLLHVGGVRDAALVLVELVVLDEVLLARRAERREELRRVPAEGAHGDAALQELVGAFSTSQARRTEHGDRHLGLATQREGRGGGGSGGDEE